MEPSTGVAATSGVDLDPHVEGGALRGLLNMRDVELVSLAQQIGELGANTVDQLNAIHNENVGVPAPNTLEGRNTGLISSDSLGFTGATTVAVTAADGTLVSRIDIDFDAGTLSVDGGGPSALGSTVGSFVTALNTALGGNGTASFTAGVLTLDAASASEGIAIRQDATTPADRGGRGFSHFFGLNDMIRAAEPSHFDTGMAAADAHGFTAGDEIDLEIRNARGELITTVTYAVGGTSIGDIITALNATDIGTYATLGLGSNGELTVTPGAAYDGYTLEVAGDGTQRSGSAVGLSELFGIGKGAQMDQATNMAILERIQMNPEQLGLAILDISGATVAGDLVVTESDNRGAVALQAIASASVAFGEAGARGATNASLGNYAASILADAGNRASLADARAMDAETVKSEIDSRRLEVQGVSLDEEMANMMVYQQAYNASARMMAAAQQMYDTLLQLV